MREGRAGLDEGAVGALWDLDEKRVVVTLAGVVLDQAGAEAAGFDADGVVDGRVVGGGAVEDVDGDAVLLERLVRVGEGVMKDVSEEQLAAMRSAKGAGSEDAIELSFYGAVIGQRRRRKVADRRS